MLLANSRAENLLASRHVREGRSIDWDHIKKVVLQVGKSVAWMCLQRTLLSPFEVVISRMQTMKELIKDGILNQEYIGFWDCIMHIIKQQGFFALWKGNLTRILIFLTTKLLVLKFQPFFVDLVYNKLIKNQQARYPFQSRKKQKAWREYLRAFLTNVLINQSTLLITYPLHFADTKFTNDINSVALGIPTKYSGFYDLFTRTITEEGFFAVYRGYISCLLAPLIFTFASKICYGQLIIKKVPNEEDDFYGNFLRKFFVQEASVLPLEVLKKRMIINGKDSHQKYDNVVDCALKIKRKEGFRSFFYSLKYFFINSLIGNFWIYLMPFFYLTLAYKWYNQNINVN